VVAVDATAPKINVSFDRPVAYNGTHSNVPGGTPYDIGTPALALDTLSVDIPITVPAQVLAPITITQTTPTTIVIEWGENVSLLSTLGWSIANTTGHAVTIQSIAIPLGSPTQTVLTTSEHTDGGNYTLHVEAARVAGGTKISSVISNAYVGYGLPPTIYLVEATSSDAFLVTFNEPVDSFSAIDTANYSVAGLQILDVIFISASQYLVKTSSMVPDTTYTLNLVGVRDMAGNQIV
jgi:hypothetical protein